MKNKTQTWIIVSLVAVLIAVGCYFLFEKLGAGKYKWYPLYTETKNEPYATGIARDLLSTYNKGKKYHSIEGPLQKFLEDKYSEQGSNYVFIGDELYLSETDAFALHKFVANGNTALICAYDFPSVISAQIFSDCYADRLTENLIDSTVYANFAHSALKSDTQYRFNYRFYEHLAANYWYYFKYYECNTPKHFAVLGFLNTDKVNFMMLKVGKGKLLIHSNPLFFTNYYLIEKSGLDYFTKVASHLGPSHIYFDDYNRVSHAPFNPKDDEALGQSSFYYILSQPALAWAFYIALAAIIIFTVFRLKRKQKPITVIETNINTSLSFIKTISALHYMQSDYVKLVEMMHRMFLQFVKHRYYLNINNPDPAFRQLLAAKSQLPAESVNRVFELYQNTKGYQQIEAEIMVQYHRALEYFYNNCK